MPFHTISIHFISFHYISFHYLNCHPWWNNFQDAILKQTQPSCHLCICASRVNGLGKGTPRKMNDWNLKIIVLRKGKSSEANLHDFGFKMLIFQDIKPFLSPSCYLTRWGQGHDLHSSGNTIWQSSPTFQGIVGCTPTNVPLWEIAI